uniref:Uncharacterized protein n=1 Tax=Cacopsylla melanoneura TaxID=428564 RepID=A0A8D8VC40_9HEMI
MLKNNLKQWQTIQLTNQDKIKSYGTNKSKTGFLENQFNSIRDYTGTYLFSNRIIKISDKNKYFSNTYFNTLAGTGVGITLFAILLQTKKFIYLPTYSRK